MPGPFTTIPGRLEELRRLPLIILLLIIMAAAGKIPVLGAEKQEPSSKKNQVQIIDRTDYPSLYLCQPFLEGHAVWMIQARLKELGYDVEPSGCFDFSTRNVVGLFQVANGLQDTGVVEEQVWNILFYGPSGEPDLPAGTHGPEKKRLYVEIDVSKRTLKLVEEGKVIARYPVAVGKSETPTPLGEWRVVQKCLNWGDGFGTRWLGLNVPWGIFGVHGTDNPGSIGSYASHGCIRMFNRDVEKLYPQVPMGTTVRIVENGRMFPADLKPVKLKKNASGQRVVYIQSRLKELGIEFDRADGRFGNMTELAVKYFQVWHDLPPTGEIDEATYRALGMIQ